MRTLVKRRGVWVSRQRINAGLSALLLRQKPLKPKLMERKTALDQRRHKRRSAWQNLKRNTGIHTSPRQ